MASITPPTFSSSDLTPHKLTYATPNFNTTFRSNYSSSLFSYNLYRVFDSSITCRCQKDNDKSNIDRDNENPQRWDPLFVIREKFRDFCGVLKAKKDGSGSGFVKKEGEVLMNGDGDEGWDWERWKKHFIEVDEQERIVSILESQLNRAVVKEDYEDAARIKVVIAAAAINDTVGRVMSQLNKAIKEERYKDAAFIRDCAGAGLVGWWVGFSDDNQDPCGHIIRISAEHGRYLARSYSPRQLAMAADGVPLFEVFITMNEKGDYKQQPVYLKRSKDPGDSSKTSGLISIVNPLDTMDGEGYLITNEDEDTDDFEDKNDDLDVAEEHGFENNIQYIIPGAKVFKIKVKNAASIGKIERDSLREAFIEMYGEVDDNDEEEEEEEEEEEDEIELESKDELEDGTDVEQYDIDFDDSNTIIDDEGNSLIAVKVVVDDLAQRLSDDASYEDLLRVPAKLERKSPSSFTFCIEKEKKHDSSSNTQSRMHPDARIQNNHIKEVMLDLGSSIGRGKIPKKVLKDVNQMISLAISQVQNHQYLSGSTTFNRFEVPLTRDPLNGLYVGAHGIHKSEVIHLKRKFGQWQEDGSMKKSSNLEFYEYLEAVKITGDPSVPAGQVAFRAKVGAKYQLPHKGIIPEEFGVIARYRGQGRLADPGFQNPRWVDCEFLILDGKYIKGDPAVGFVYDDPEHHFMVFFNQLRLQE